MKTCPQCGFHLTDLEERCIRCGAYLETISRPDSQDLPREDFAFTGGETPSRWRWRLPGRLAAGVRRRLYFLRRALESELPADLHFRNPWVSGALSIVPGLGQLYNHQPKKAVLIILFIAACCGVAWLTLYESYSNWILLGALVAYVYSFQDAFCTAKEINRDYLPWQHRVAFYFAWIFYIWLACILGQYIAVHGLFQFRYQAYDELAPYLSQGERYFVDMLSTPKVGDVVLYDPKRLIIEQIGELENNLFVLNPTSMIERVVAGPGQTFERRNGVFYRDGQQVPLEEAPLVTKYLSPNLKLVAPPGAYVVVYSYTFGHDLIYEWAGMPSRPPKLDQPGQIVKNWAEVCIVEPQEIKGRLLFVYQPPAARRCLR